MPNKQKHNFLDEAKARAKRHNDRERNIAKTLVSTPTPTNIISALEHYWNSIPYLGGAITMKENYHKPDAGIPPTVGLVKGIEYLSKVGAISRAINSAIRGYKTGKSITLANATAKTAKEWDDAYNAALAVNNIKEAQRLRDLHFIAKAPKSKVVKSDGTPLKTYHTVGDKYNPNFTEFNPTIEGQHSAIYTTDNPIMSGSYTKELTSEAERDYIIESTRLQQLSQLERRSKQYLDIFGDKYRKIYGDPKSARKQIIKNHSWVGGEINPNRQKQLYINLERPLVINNGGRYWNEIDLSQLPKDVYDNISVDWANSGYGISNYTTRSLEKAQKLAGKYDGAIISDVIDYGGKKLIAGDKMPSSTVYQVNSPNNLKLADAVTYDNNGNIIPLSKRDNFSLSDFRYGVLPFVGVTGASLVNKRKKRFGGNIRRTLATGGSIYIKPSHRGRLTELKARTGKSEAELYNDGNPAHKKNGSICKKCS